jgi:glycosyltransferase involved in cell wall biosynthesis
MSGERVCMLVRNDCRTDFRVLKEAGSVARAGYRVTVVAANTYGPLERETRDGFEIIRVPVERARTRVERYLNLFPRTMRRMAEVAAGVGAAIYHAHDTDATVPAWLAARRVPRAQLIYDAHEVGFLSFSEMLHYSPFSWMTVPGALSGWGWQSLFEWIIRRRTSAVISVNDVLADLQAAHYGIPRPTVVMNCPPLAPVAADQRRVLADRIGVAPETPIVICSGMFALDRGDGPGLENLLRSAALLHRGVIVLVGNVGALPQFEPLRALAASPGLADRAFVLPPVSPAEVATYLAGASIGVIPLQLRGHFRYASPNKLFEYMAAGLPVVYGDLPPVHVLCERYGCGLPCDPGSPASIAGALNRLLDDPALHARQRAGALAAAQVYNWEAQEQVLLDLYRRLLSAAPAHAGRATLSDQRTTIP